MGLGHCLTLLLVRMLKSNLSSGHLHWATLPRLQRVQCNKADSSRLSLQPTFARPEDKSRSDKGLHEDETISFCHGHLVYLSIHFHRVKRPSNCLVIICH
ncbi:hypothetical protein BDN72DRAFT_836815 [Pluteus cervinus]|uniref:Uncharacterized protein n=1 Tax=Pluteus cervinus TaxID=181527 RepID=A0ACD3B185_9AGAR|nr:hypothetical protein BDN72DRAFT_836815 [Pluteus cervinus]